MSKAKTTVALTVDFYCAFSVWARCFCGPKPPSRFGNCWLQFASIVIFIPLMAVMGVYNEIARFAGFPIYQYLKSFCLYAYLCGDTCL